jgi:hypothetical protein
MEIENIKQFEGQHCETTSNGILLKNLGMEFSEPMLFGLGEGLSFIVWNIKSMSLPFIAGRIKSGILTQNIAKNLNLKLIVTETSSKNAAWDNVKEIVDRGKPVGLKLDTYYLEYFKNPFHFAGHYAVIYGYDNKNAFLIDTKQQGGKVRTSLESLAKARSEKGFMASKNLYYILEKTNEKYNLNETIITAIKNNANEYLNPPIKNSGYKGIYTTSLEIIKWFKTSNDLEKDFRTTAKLMEKAGTGGALFRNLYRDFLKECYEILNDEKIKIGYESFIEIAALWTSVSTLFQTVSETRDCKYIQEASDILKKISEKEKKAMELLQTI